MINELTDEQVAKMDDYIEKWINIGVSTEKINVEKSLAALKVAYEQVNLPFPKRYEVYDSPYAAIIAMKEKYDTTVAIGNFIFGAHDAHWLSFFDYFKEVCNIKECEKLTPFMELAKHCGWVLLFDDLVVLTQKPVSIRWDDQNRTHCENDYAIKYRDNYGIAVWHGTRIPSEWIFDKKTITPEVMFQWENVEQRRCACEIIGWDKVLEKLESTLIDEDGDPTIGKLLEVNLPDIGKEKFLLALDPNTNKLVGLPVPREMKTALEANAWTYNIDVSKAEFKPAFRV